MTLVEQIEKATALIKWQEGGKPLWVIRPQGRVAQASVRQINCYHVNALDLQKFHLEMNYLTPGQNKEEWKFGAVELADVFYSSDEAYRETVRRAGQAHQGDIERIMADWQKTAEAEVGA